MLKPASHNHVNILSAFAKKISKPETISRSENTLEISRNFEYKAVSLTCKF